MLAGTPNSNRSVALDVSNRDFTMTSRKLPVLMILQVPTNFKELTQASGDDDKFYVPFIPHTFLVLFVLATEPEERF